MTVLSVVTLLLLVASCAQTLTLLILIQEKARLTRQNSRQGILVEDLRLRLLGEESVSLSKTRRIIELEAVIALARKNADDAEEDTLVSG